MTNEEKVLQQFDAIMHRFRMVHTEASVLDTELENLSKYMASIVIRKNRHVKEILSIINDAEEHCRACKVRLANAINAEENTATRRKID